MNDEVEAGRTLMTILGVPFTATSQSWKFVPPKIVIGTMAGLIFLPDEPFEARFGWSIVYGLLLVCVLILHILGHIISSKLVSPPMTEARITPILIQTLYQNDPLDVSARTHLIRSLGGPLMNLLLGIMAILSLGVWRSHILAFWGAANLCIALLVLLPLPTVDGEVIWREISCSFKGRQS